MTATNMCYNFVGFRYSPPVAFMRTIKSINTLSVIIGGGGGGGGLS